MLELRIERPIAERSFSELHAEPALQGLLAASSGTCSACEEKVPRERS